MVTMRSSWAREKACRKSAFVPASGSVRSRKLTPYSLVENYTAAIGHRTQWTKVYVDIDEAKPDIRNLMRWYIDFDTSNG